MPIFKCSKCGVIDNTATSGYWHRYMSLEKGQTPPPPLCSQCDPEIGQWHGRFERNTPGELKVVEGPDGFYYDPEDKYLAKLRAEKRQPG